MPYRLRRLPLPLQARALIAAGLLGTVATLAIGCDYQLALQPTPTPTTPSGLHVTRIAGASTPQPAATPGAGGSSIADLIAQYLGSNNQQGGAAAPPAAAAPADVPQAASAPAAAAAPASAPAASISAPPVAAAPSVSYAAPAAASAPVNAASPAPSTSPTPAASATASASASRTASFTSAPNTRPASSSRASGPTPTPTPSPTQAPTTAPTQAPTPAPTQPPTPAPTQKPAPAPVSVYLHDGMNTFVYVGPSLPANQALARLAGQYDTVYYSPSGSGQSQIYRPGIDPPGVIANGSVVSINIKPGNGSLFTMYPPN